MFCINTANTAVTAPFSTQVLNLIWANIYHHEIQKCFDFVLSPLMSVAISRVSEKCEQLGCQMTSLCSRYLFIPVFFCILLYLTKIYPPQASVQVCFFHIRFFHRAFSIFMCQNSRKNTWIETQHGTQQKCSEIQQPCQELSFVLPFARPNITASIFCSYQNNNSLISRLLKKMETTRDCGLPARCQCFCLCGWWWYQIFTKPLNRTKQTFPSWVSSACLFLLRAFPDRFPVRSVRKSVSFIIDIPVSNLCNSCFYGIIHLFNCSG